VQLNVYLEEYVRVRIEEGWELRGRKPKHMVHWPLQLGRSACKRLLKPL